MLRTWSVSTSKHRRTPVGKHDKITKDEVGNVIDMNLYKNMIGSLLYLIIRNSNICYSMGVCARYQASPKDSHLLEIKNIINYVCETGNYDIWDTQDTTSSLVGYCDADCVGNSDEEKSTSYGCFFLGNNLVS